MVTIKDGCGCDPCDCDWKQKLKEAYARASVSVNKIGDFDGAIYYPDGSGFVKLPIPRLSEVQQISTNAQDIADLKVADIQLQANITAEETARKAKDDNLDSDIARIDSTDARQSELIQDNADRINSTYNDLVATEATVATHDSEIITLQANNQALAKSLVSDVIMTDGTTAGSVQVSIEKVDGTVVTSANYKWGRDIGVRLEAGTQAGYVKAVISLSDGTELVSNEYKIVEVLESDVYVTAITLIADQAAGTLGGNISYSNGTTQTINSVSVPTAPGVTSAIEALQTRMTAVEQKNTAQDSQITSLNNRVQAIEDTPGVGQFGAGKLGTIAGSTTDGRIKAEDDGTGSVNGWADLKGRVSTAEGQIVTAQNDISGIKTKNTQQDSAISGLESSKVNVAQGVANAGKALVVGEDGNITPTIIPTSAKEIGGIIHVPFLNTISNGQSTSGAAILFAYAPSAVEGNTDVIYNTIYEYSTVSSVNYKRNSFNLSNLDSHSFLNELIKVGINELPNGNYRITFEPMIYRLSYQPAYFDINKLTFDCTITDKQITNITLKSSPLVPYTDNTTDYYNGVLSHIQLK